MSKNLFIWSLDPARVPNDPRERGAGWGMLMEMIKQDKEKGVLKDWGAFTSEGKGYCIVEGTNLEIMKMTDQYTPYVQFEIHPISTSDEVNKLISHLAG
jgi:hypothetical protein